MSKAFSECTQLLKSGVRTPEESIRNIDIVITAYGNDQILAFIFFTSTL